MNVASKVNSMSMMRRMVMAAAFAAGLWARNDLYLGSSGSGGNPAFSPKRTKLKGWQKNRREAQR